MGSLHQKVSRADCSKRQEEREKIVGHARNVEKKEAPELSNKTMPSQQYTKKPKTLAERRAREQAESEARMDTIEADLAAKDTLTKKVFGPSAKPRALRTKMDRQLSTTLENYDSGSDEVPASKPSTPSTCKRDHPSDIDDEYFEPAHSRKKSRLSTASTSMDQIPPVKDWPAEREVTKHGVANNSIGAAIWTPINNDDKGKDRRPSTQMNPHKTDKQKGEQIRWNNHNEFRETSIGQAIKPITGHTYGMHVDLKIVGILAERSRKEGTGLQFAVFRGDMTCPNGVTWEDQAWMEATDKRQEHMQDWIEKKDAEAAVTVYDLKAGVALSTVALWPRPKALYEQQSLGRKLNERRQLLKLVMDYTERELRRDVFEVIDTERFRFAHKQQARQAQSHGMSTASEVLRRLQRNTLFPTGGHPDTKYFDFMIEYLPGNNANSDTVTRSAMELISPLFPDRFEPYKTRIGNIKSYLNFCSSNIKESATLAHNLEILLAQMIVNGPYLIGNRHFTLLAYLVYGESRLQQLLNRYKIIYPVNTIDKNLSVWMEIYYEGCIDGYDEWTARGDVDYLRSFFGMLRTTIVLED
ncbi:hypothetical protein IAQ61_002107 [Plenodomus lingam]|uniref:uncharacterized protein n=1 Tax=Leptosphaeria maculans TaxID=5022 RepID=UPI003323A3BE|nr:hypothetical protein IAQ61_002107 [Plenodomus lingam]